MNRCKTKLILSAVLSVAAVAAGSSSARAQTFQRYLCADRTQFIAGFYDHDSRAYLQIDGRPVTLARRLTLSGTRYSGSGITLKISKDRTTLRHAGRPVTTCELI
jgi:membrane-bound inhibitor of C-type lysozyme